MEKVEAEKLVAKVERTLRLCDRVEEALSRRYAKIEAEIEELRAAKVDPKVIERLGEGWGVMRSSAIFGLKHINPLDGKTVGTTLPVVSSSLAGIMTAADKQKLDSMGGGNVIYETSTSQPRVKTALFKNKVGVDALSVGKNFWDYKKNNYFDYPILEEVAAKGMALRDVDTGGKVWVESLGGGNLLLWEVMQTMTDNRMTVRSIVIRHEDGQYSWSMVRDGQIYELTPYSDYQRTEREFFELVKRPLLEQGLREIGYTDTEIAECFEDVPVLEVADVARARELYDNYDPTMTAWTSKTFAGYLDLVVFPKIDTSQLTNMGTNTFSKMSKLRYFPRIDTSHVTTLSQVFYDSATISGPPLRRVPALDWSSLTSTGWGLFFGLNKLEIVPPMSFPKLKNATFLFGDNYMMEECPIDLNWSQITAAHGIFRKCHALKRIPGLTAEGVLDAPLCTGMNSAFQVISAEAMAGLTRLNAPKCTAAMSLIGDRYIWGFLQGRAPELQLANGVDFSQALCSFKGMTEVPDYSAFAPGNMSETFYDNPNLERIEGLDFSRVTNMSNTFGNCPKLAYLRLLNLGQSSKVTTYNFSGTRWGVGGAENLRSLVDSLLTDSYDRASAGMSAVTLTLPSASYNLLTSAQRAAITAKGFTIVKS